MNVIFAQSPIPKSIFLAGPTPRKDTPATSWRPEALRILDQQGFSGTVYVPEQSDFKSFDNYDGQVLWEWEALEQATVIVFWVPRDMATMPGLITNVEFGLWVQSGKVLLGYPEGAERMSYLDMLATRFNVPVYRQLDVLLRAAIMKSWNPTKRIF